MTGECKVENRSKVKIEKWLGEPNLKAYEQYVMQWKEILENARVQLEETPDLEEQKKISMNLLQTYYLSPFNTGFFAEFGLRI